MTLIQFLSSKFITSQLKNLDDKNALDKHARTIKEEIIKHFNERRGGEIIESTCNEILFPFMEILIDDKEEYKKILSNELVRVSRPNYQGVAQQG